MLRLEHNAATIHEMGHPSQITANNNAGRISIGDNFLHLLRDFELHVRSLCSG